MKNLSLTLLAFLFMITGSVQAQDAKKAFKSAEKAIKSFIKNPTDESVSISAIKESLNTAFSSPAISDESKNWIKKGDLLTKVADIEYIHSVTPGNVYEIQYKDAALDAYDAYIKAMEMGDKKKYLSGISGLESHLNNTAALVYTSKDYGSAFKLFQKSLDAKKTLNAAGKDSRLDVDTLYRDQVLFTAVSGYYGDEPEIAKPYFLELKQAGGADPVVYEALYSMTSETNPEEALGYLEEGRQAHPDDTGMLFSEINYYLKSGQLEALITKLETAIEKEPDNITVYTTMGSVYDQLHQKEVKAGNTAKATEYFDKALEYYNISKSKDPTNFDAAYSVGALYYNKAAGMVDQLNTLANDFSADGMKKYDAKKAEMDNLFGEALPFFKEAEELKSDDLNTIIALKEIYARMNKLEKAEEYKAKLESMK